MGILTFMAAISLFMGPVNSREVFLPSCHKLQVTVLWVVYQETFTLATSRMRQ